MPTRRAVLRRAGLAAGAAALAGCTDGGDGVPGFEPDGPALRVSVPTDTLPDDIDLNPFSLTPQGREIAEPFDALVLPAVAPTGEPLAGEHTWTVDGEAVTVPTVVTDVAADAETVRLSFDDRFGYWNGESLDGEAFRLSDRVDWLAFGERESFPGDLVSATEYHRSLAADSWSEVERARYPGGPPMPPSFTEPWVERLEAAATDTEREEQVAELTGDEVTLDRFVEEGFGSGAYRIESTDAVSREGTGGPRWEGYPGDVGIPNLVVRTPGGGAAPIESGTADLGEGVVAEDGDVQPDTTPAGVEQVAQYPSPVEGGLSLLFNWGNEHLGRLWVRRALVAALPLDRVVGNVYGAGGTPPDQHSGLLSGVARARLGEAFVDSLYEYPVERDAETAAEWMRTAGYARPGEQWEAPDGDPVAVTLLAPGSEQTVTDSLASAIESFGVGVRTATRSLRPTDEFGPAVRDGNFDLAVGFVPGGFSPVEGYAAATGVEGPLPTGPTVAAAGDAPGDCDRGADWLAPPGTVTVPAEPGLRVEGVDYGDGGTTYRHDGGEDVSVCDAVGRLRDPATDDGDRLAAARDCARWYNYALPTLVLGQAQAGVFANTAEFALPDDERALTAARSLNWSPVQYHVQAGTVR